MFHALFNITVAVVFLTIAHAWSLGIPSPNAHAKRQEPERRFIISFGDSYSSTGFKAEEAWPSKDNPWGNPPYPGRTFSGGGPTWVGSIIKKLAPEGTQSFNFARGGAVVNKTRYEDQQPKDFREQVDEFFHTGLASKPERWRWNARNSVFVSWFGINDIHFYPDKTKDDEVYEIWRPVVDNYFQQVDRYFLAGARNFVVVAVPPFDRSPKYTNMTKDGDKGPWVRKAISGYNEMAMSHVRSFRAWHPEVNMHFVDISSNWNYMLDHPEEFGAQALPTCAQIKGVDCLWANDLHATPIMQEVAAKAIYDILDWAGFWGSVWLTKRDDT